jgi:hypothetical protein
VITGGLVVPLFFVALSVFGGFVSMLRRVPEIQERISRSAADPLSKERARELLVFEVLQLLAAPLIAITAYYLIDPGSRATSIALAFIAGFSSETVLLYVRALTEKLQPETLRGVSNVPLSASALSFGKQAKGTRSAPQTVTLSNRTSAAVQGHATLAGEFDSPDLGPFVLPPGTSKSFAIVFAPQGAGAKAGHLQLLDNGSGSPRILNLSGEAPEDPQAAADAAPSEPSADPVRPDSNPA